MNLELSFLASLPLFLFWSSFLVENHLINKLLWLLATSLCLPLAFVSQWGIFWPCALILILISTGLIVVFAYITSLDQANTRSHSWSLILILAGCTALLIQYEPQAFAPLSLLPLHSESGAGSVSQSLFLVGILLVFVVLFIRLTYSKGGGFRNNF